MPEEILVSQLIINELTTEQYKTALAEGKINESEVYIITDKVEVHNESVDAHPHILEELNKKATAAQGEKADTALQSIVAGPGLKVSNKVNGSQTIDIDEDVVFIFDGGTSTTVL